MASAARLRPPQKRFARIPPGGALWAHVTLRPGASDVPEVFFGALLVAPGGVLAISTLGRSSELATRLLSAALWLAGFAARLLAKSAGHPPPAPP